MLICVVTGAAGAMVAATGVGWTAPRPTACGVWSCNRSVVSARKGADGKRKDSFGLIRPDSREGQSPSARKYMARKDLGLRGCGGGGRRDRIKGILAAVPIAPT
eukprot:SAG31_NODE_103_length_25164_cov_12.124317_2_plen_104_part_00